MSRMTKVLVTGGAGFIGSHVIDWLIESGFKVLAFDHSAPGFLRNLHPDDALEFFHGDVLDDVAVTEAAAHVDGIVHLAAVLGTQETIQNPRPSAQTNILGAMNVFEAAVQYDLPVVYAGVGNHWMREHGAGSYTISKTVVEDYARMYNQFRGAKITVVRPVNAYGPRQSIAAPFGSSKVRKIIPSFACHALAGLDIEVYGDGTQISDCVHVFDVARVFVEALRWTAINGPGPHAFEVGPVQSTSVNDVARMIAKEAAILTGQSYPVDIHHVPMRPGEVPNAVVSADTMTLEPLDIDPADFISLENGLTQVVRWYAKTWLPGWQAQR